MDQKGEYFVIVELHAFIGPHLGADKLANLQHFNKALDDRMSSESEPGKRRIFLYTSLNLHLDLFVVLYYNT